MGNNLVNNNITINDVETCLKQFKESEIELIGTEKQIKYANDIKREIVENIEEYIELIKSDTQECYRIMKNHIELIRTITVEHGFEKNKEGMTKAFFFMIKNVIEYLAVQKKSGRIINYKQQLYGESYFDNFIENVNINLHMREHWGK